MLIFVQEPGSLYYHVKDKVNLTFVCYMGTLRRCEMVASNTT